MYVCTVCHEKCLCDQIQFVVVVVVVVDHKDDDELGTLLSRQWGIHGSVLVYLLNSSIYSPCSVAPVAAILNSQKPTVTISEGASGALMCTATGVPAPTISWFRNGVLLSDDSVTLVITNSTDDTMSLLSVTSTLNATSVMRDSAFATITCTASNGVGANSSDNTQFIVLCKLLMFPVIGHSLRW